MLKNLLFALILSFSVASPAAPEITASNIICISGAQVSAPADTAENILATCSIPANALGANGMLEISSLWSVTNSANTKTLRVRFSGISGTIFQSFTATTIGSINALVAVSNRNATNSQVSSATIVTSYGTTSAAVITGAVDTTAATTVVLTCLKASAGETCALERYFVRINGAYSQLQP